MDKDGPLAARRKRKWKVYDVRAFENSPAQFLGEHPVGANLFEIVLDLSFRRCGALLVYDPRHATREHIRNEASIIYVGWKAKTPETEDVCAQALIGRSLQGVVDSARQEPVFTGIVLAANHAKIPC